MFFLGRIFIWRYLYASLVFVVVYSPIRQWISPGQDPGYLTLSDANVTWTNVSAYNPRNLVPGFSHNLLLLFRLYFYLLSKRSIHRSKIVHPITISLPQDIQGISALQLLTWLSLLIEMENNLECFELRNVRDFYLLLFQETWCNHILVHSWQIFHKWASTLSLKTERRYFAGHTKWYTRLLTLWHKATYVLDSFCIALPFDDILSPKGRPYVASNGENPKEALTCQRQITRLF